MYLRGERPLAARIRTLGPVKGSLIVEFTTESAFILATIIDKKIVKIEASFLAW